MKTFFSSLVLLSILALPAIIVAGAEDRPPSLQKGKVLILKNEFTIEGDIELVGDRYRVLRKNGEKWVQAESVLALMGSLTDAYGYLRGRINADDPDERLRLSRWCRDNGLQQQALAELQAAANLRPDHAETRRLLQHWKQTTASERAPSRGTGKNAAAPAQPMTGTLPSIEVTTESLGLFATRVQPILMNTCARCHATGRGGQFHLTQVYDDNINNRQTLEHNLAAVLAEVNVNQPEASRLLVKALSDHAHTGQAPLRDRQSAPYRTLETWVKVTVANNPQLRDRNPPVENKLVSPPTDNVFGSLLEASPKAKEQSDWGADGRQATSPVPSPVTRGEKGKTESHDSPKPPDAAAAPPSSPPAATTDPYDPEPFNRKVHPEASKSEPGK
jgi:hypothetical protein